jgi:hypothetical protein
LLSASGRRRRRADLPLVAVRHRSLPERHRNKTFTPRWPSLATFSVHRCVEAVTGCGGESIAAPLA